MLRVSVFLFLVFTRAQASGQTEVPTERQQDGSLGKFWSLHPQNTNVQAVL